MRWLLGLVGVWMLLAGKFAGGLAAQEAEWTVPGAPGGKLSAQAVAIQQGILTLQDAAGKEHNVKLADLPADERKFALIRVVGSGVVVVQAKDALDTPSGLGSGFVAHASGLVLTNYHVVRGAGSILVLLRDGKEPLAAELVAVDRKNDIAVLKIGELPKGTAVLELAAKERPKQGQTVWSIGHPGGLKDTVSWGDVNAVRTTKELPPPLDQLLQAGAETAWIQTNAVIDRGSSGGPLLNADGQAIGMNTFLSGRFGFALHLALAAELFKSAESAQAMKLPLTPAEGESLLGWWSRDVGPLYLAMQQELQQLDGQVGGLPREQVLARVQALNKKHRAKFLALARGDAAGWPAFQALFYVLDLTADGSDDAARDLAEVARLLAEHHLQRPELMHVLSKLGAQPGAAVRPLIEKTLAGSPHREVQGHAAYALSQNRLMWLAYSGGLDLAEAKAARGAIGELAGRLDTDFAAVPFGQASGKQAAAQVKAQLQAVPVGLPARATTGIDTAGKEFQLADYKGKVILLDFFADWCHWCKKMYPFEQKLVVQRKDQPFALLGVNCDDHKVLSDLVKNGTVTWRCWADGERGPIAGDWGVNAWPTLLLIDANGIVRRQFSGEPKATDLQDAIDLLVREAGKK